MVIDGEIEVQIEEKDVVSERQFWGNTLIMYALGEPLSMNAVKKFMMNTWNFVSLPELYYNEEGYFMIKFHSQADKDAVLIRGSYTIYRKPMFLHEWTPEFQLKDDLLRVLPLWVIFPQLPLLYWGEDSIGKIASAIGKPILMDECTTKKLRVSYARVLIEVDVTIELKDTITIKTPNGEKLRQQVDYEWKPPYCKKCNKVGHQCKQKEKKAWIPKQKEPEETIPMIQAEKKDDRGKQKEVVTEENPWLQVISNGKPHRALRFESREKLDCTNEFDVLGVGECSTVNETVT
ncbi:uncharacterized protein LOC131604108 [Vicia villosa]|uniref:uncharacterized protein LOC131604108 n=1 Tax=Vicia villosa TaxID=3911 RepID=UPI00273BB3C6|nr:uncharacterized protein LOC131604108 [Vicia villosa]